MRRIVLVLLLVATILVGACGDSGTDSDTGSASVWCTIDGGVCTDRDDDASWLEDLLTWPGD